MPQPLNYPLRTVNRAHVFFEALELAARAQHLAEARRPAAPPAASRAGGDRRRRVAVTLALLLTAGALALAGGLA